MKSFLLVAEYRQDQPGTFRTGTHPEKESQLVPSTSAVSLQTMVKADQTVTDVITVQPVNMAK